MTAPASRDNRFVAVIRRFACTQRVLVVTDGLEFGDDDFGLSEFVAIIRAAGHAVHTAHRRGRGPELTIPGHFNFKTAGTPVTRENYDQLWLFGVENDDGMLTTEEQEVISRFMQSGGGVFATGDHANLGQGMGAHIPRVRKMRDWSSVPMSGTTRLDTIADAGGDSIQQFEDQSDAIAQRIFPVYSPNGGSHYEASTWSVHPVLRHSSGAVDCLPDHPHESKCLAPEPDEGEHAGVEEWPKSLRDGERIEPELVAKSISAGRFLVVVDRDNKPPVMPCCFGAISAYNGHPAGVGRIVCDATWHHFINLNLNGKGALPDANGVERIGLYASPGVPTAGYLKIQAYFRNTVRWLAPPGLCEPLMLAAAARFDVVALELSLPRKDPDWRQLLEIGRELGHVIDRRFGPGSLTSAVDDMLDPIGGDSLLVEILHSRLALQARKRDEGVESLLPLADMRRVVFASLVNVLADRLPPDEHELERLMTGLDDLARRSIKTALVVAEGAISVYLEQALQKSYEYFGLLSRRGR